jgi:hypothetical protein
MLANYKGGPLRMKILIGTKILHGSPDYENEETIASIYAEPAWPDHVTIEFESGFFTRMTMADYGEFIKNGKVSYTQKFPDGNALEVMEILQPDELIHV